LHGSRRIASRPGALDMRVLRCAVRSAGRRLRTRAVHCPVGSCPGVHCGSRGASGRPRCAPRVSWRDCGTGPLARKPCRTASLCAEIPLSRPRVLPKWTGPPLNDASGRLTKVSDRAISGPSSAPRKPPKPDIQTRLRSQFSTSRLKLLSRRDGSFLATDALRGTMRFLGRRLRVVLR
jgi:hypothetical protein